MAKRHHSPGKRGYRCVDAATLEKEVSYILQEFGSETVFIGSIAMMAHTERGRRTKDIDVILPHECTAMLIERGFTTDKKGAWYGPHGVKVDFYTRGEKIGGIPVEDIERDAQTKKWNDYEIRVPKLEHMMLMKMVATERSKPADVREAHKSDLRTLAIEHTKRNDIDWKYAEHYRSNFKRRLEELI